MARWYTHAIEHFIKITLYEPKQQTEATEIWRRKVYSWLMSLSYADQQFIQSLFANKEIPVGVALDTLPGDFNNNCARWGRLQKNFALYCGFI